MRWRKQSVTELVYCVNKAPECAAKTLFKFLPEYLHLR